MMFFLFFMGLCGRILLDYNLGKKVFFRQVSCCLISCPVLFVSSFFFFFLTLVLVSFKPVFLDSDALNYFSLGTESINLIDSFFSPLKCLVLCYLSSPPSQSHCGLGPVKRIAGLLRLGRCLPTFRYFDNLSLRENEEDHEDIS